MKKLLTTAIIVTLLGVVGKAVAQESPKSPEAIKIIRIVNDAYAYNGNSNFSPEKAKKYAEIVLDLSTAEADSLLKEGRFTEAERILVAAVATLEKLEDPARLETARLKLEELKQEEAAFRKVEKDRFDSFAEALLKYEGTVGEVDGRQYAVMLGQAKDSEIAVKHGLDGCGKVIEKKGKKRAGERVVRLLGKKDGVYTVLVAVPVE